MEASLLGLTKSIHCSFDSFVFVMFCRGFPWPLTIHTSVIFFPAVLWNLVLGPGWAPNEVQSEPTMEYLY